MAKTMVLPNQMRDEDNKALGRGYIVEQDKLHVMAAINFSKREKKKLDLVKTYLLLCLPLMFISELNTKLNVFKFVFLRKRFTDSRLFTFYAVSNI